MSIVLSRPIRVAFIDYGLEPDKPGRSGVSDTVWDMAGELVRLGHEAHIVGSYTTDLFPEENVIVHNFPAPPIGYRNIVGQLWILKRAASIIRRINPDLVHAREYLSTAVFAKLRIGVPMVLTVPGNIYKRIQDGHSYEWHMTQILKWAARVSAVNCDCVVATSREMGRWWQLTGTPPSKTKVIPLGVNPSRFHPVSGPRERLNLPREDVIFLYAGRFAREKGLFDLVEAISSIRASSTSFKLILIGKGPEERELKQMIVEKDLESIICLQPWVRQDELKVWYSAADAFVLPSWNEPFGKVFAEALACSTPVIASATEGPKDHITTDENGFLYPVGDPHALASILNDLLNNREALLTMRESSIDYAQKHLAWPQIMQRILNEVYLPLVNA